jgi:hypothetical protein
MNIIDLADAAPEQRTQVARMLHEEFNQPRWNDSWETLAEAESEVAMLCEAGHMGYIITGVMPDANGPGQPDIFMSKRFRHTPGESARR